MILASVFLLTSSSEGALVVRNRWINREIPFVIAAGVSDEGLIRKAIRVWNSALGVNVLRPRQPSDTHFVLIKPGLDSDGVGCKAFIGFNENAREHAVYTDNCAGFADILHELGHVFGLEHEHQRCDAPEYVTIARSVQLSIAELRTKIPELESQYTPIPCFPDMAGTQYLAPSSPYDFFSIMHYRPFVLQGETKLLCLATTSQCLRFTLTAKGLETLRTMGIGSVEDLARKRQERDGKCFDTEQTCITQDDLRAVKALYEIP